MNINAVKGAYACVRCCKEAKGQGALDLYARVKYGERCEKGRNSKKLYALLCEDLHIGNPIQHRAKAEALPPVQEIPRASDDIVHQTYSKLLSFKYFVLNDTHRENLHKRGFSDTTIDRNEYRSIEADFSWVNRYKTAWECYETMKWTIGDDRILKKKPRERIVAGLVVASALRKAGCALEGVPGFFRINGIWCFNAEPGMLVPTRNIHGQIVALQVRRDKPADWDDFCNRTNRSHDFLRYMTISSKGLPDGVTTDISRAHYPLGNSSLDDPETEVCVTEGPLKADAAVELMGGKKMFFVALHGTSNNRELPGFFQYLKEHGRTCVYNAFDMDKLTNVHVAKAGVSVRKLAKAAGLSFHEKCWDTEYAKEKLGELTAICCEHDIFVPTTLDVFKDLANVSQALFYANIPHSRVRLADGREEKHYWSDKTKGIDDYLLSLR